MSEPPEISGVLGEEVEYENATWNYTDPRTVLITNQIELEPIR
ncbi:MAG: hypothetical protein ACW99G_13525 [Candidatus Thorarchaeota archaeon]